VANIQSMTDDASASTDGARSSSPYLLELLGSGTSGFANETGSISTVDPRTETRILKRSRDPAAPAQPKANMGSIRPEDRDAFGRYFKQAVAAADNIVSKNEADDVVGKVNAASDLSHTLDDLWRLRQMHAIEWQSILNFLQTALRRSLSAGDVELFGIEQCDALRRVVSGYLSGRSLDSHDTDEVMELLERTGFESVIPFPANEE